MSLRAVRPRGKSIATELPSRAMRSIVRPAGERQAEHAGDLVERLAGGVVDGRAERAHVVGDVRHQQQRRSGRRTPASPAWAPGAGRARRCPPRRAPPGGSRRTAGCRARRRAPSPRRHRRAGRRPGPGRTSRRSRRGRRARTPASRQARSIVGTIASRWARLATSGTTPPNRACSSTLLATASTSSSGRGRSRHRSRRRRSRCRAPGARRHRLTSCQVQPHDERVDVARLVVACGAPSMVTNPVLS